MDKLQNFKSYLTAGGLVVLGMSALYMIGVLDITEQAAQYTGYALLLLFVVSLTAAVSHK